MNMPAKQVAASLCWLFCLPLCRVCTIKRVSWRFFLKARFSEYLRFLLCIPCILQSRPKRNEPVISHIPIFRPTAIAVYRCRPTAPCMDMATPYLLLSWVWGAVALGLSFHTLCGQRALSLLCLRRPATDLSRPARSRPQTHAALLATGQPLSGRLLCRCGRGGSPCPS